VAHRRNVIFTQGDVRVAMSYHSRARTWNRRTTVQRDSVKRCGIDGAIVAVLRLQGPSSHDWARRPCSRSTCAGPCFQAAPFPDQLK
jgi:hypothetical protein